MKSVLSYTRASDLQLQWCSWKLDRDSESLLTSRFPPRPAYSPAPQVICSNYKIGEIGFQVIFSPTNVGFPMFKWNIYIYTYIYICMYVYTHTHRQNFIYCYRIFSKTYCLVIKIRNRMVCIVCCHSNLKKKRRGFPGGSVVQNLPANAGDMSLIPGLGRSHMPQSN